MNWWKPLYEVLFAPFRVFSAMADKPRWLAALLAVMLVTAAVTAVIMKPIVMPEQMERIARNPDISEEAREQILNRMESPMVFWSGLIGALVSQPLVMLIVALAYWGLFSFLGGQAGFRHMFSATVHGALVTIPASLIKVPLMFAMGTAKVHASLALLLSPDAEETFLYRLLAQADLFAVWSLIIMAIGFSVYSGVKRNTSYWATFGLWAAWVLASSALGGALHFGPR
jgi:hypothetical protein